MSVETKLSLGFHEFFRYAIPGYVYLLVFFLPVILTASETVTIKPLSLLNPIAFSTLLVVAGPIIGYLMFHTYYPVYRHCFYDYRKTKPFQTVEQYADGKGIGWPSEQRFCDKKEMLVRALEDITVYSKPYLRGRKQDLEPVKERLNFLYSSFHSLGDNCHSYLAGHAQLVNMGVD